MSSIKFCIRIIKVSISAFALSIILGATPSYAVDLSAHAMLGKMDPNDHYTFVAGMIEGIAYHRYAAFNKDSAGMNCIYDWFYDGQRTIDVIYAAFARFPDHPPAAVLAALAERECPQ